jgi:hypothetical protein
MAARVLACAGGGVELLDGKGVAVCFTDLVEARERVLTPPEEPEAPTVDGEGSGDDKISDLMGRPAPESASPPGSYGDGIT